ncbi:UvrD-helicase domain-containing protein [Solibacillus sp. A46]|uniref:DNA 3'-5' helicase n=1 Tax=Solibacillus faecavium TaxID=2762221 RepID=A0ABR8XXH5_9BACL|nr:UvrD-helicase domain-containing protein [Solibacillus faecavium]
MEDGDLVELILIVIIILGIVFGGNRLRNKKLIPDIKLLEASERFKDDLEHLKQHYIANTDLLNLKRTYLETAQRINLLSKRLLKSQDSFLYFNQTYPNLDKLVPTYNEVFIDKELTEAKHLLSNIDGKALDPQQSRAVVTNEDNTLVVAGAGSGKTLTISGKVKYLVERLHVDPKEILLISFTASSAKEMTERIKEKLDLPIDAMTFHKLGLDTITNEEKQRPDISDSLSDYVTTYFNQQALHNPSVMKEIIRFYATYLAVPKDIEKFTTLGEYKEDQSSHDLETLRSKVINTGEELKVKRRTLKFEQVKSLEEVMIANYLYLHGVNYEYEAVYPFETDQFRKRYRPDFYLPDYNVYLEHFGVNKNNRAPWLTPIEEQKYIEGMQWKRSLHLKNQTKLLETYSHYVSSGVLFEKLEDMLRKLNIPLIEADYASIYRKLLIEQKQNQQFKEFKNLVSTFITLFKSNGYDVQYYQQLEAAAKQGEIDFLRDRTLLFLKIVRPVYEGYQEELRKNLAIDFNDMINKATDIVKTKLPTSIQYKYIIIDEFQDISMGRFRLVKALKDLTNAKIFAVGDDWQAIYRFAGSDLNIFTKFEQFFGFSKQLRIEKTYRNSQQLIDIASHFVVKNPIQIKKQLNSDKRLLNPLKIYGYVDNVVKAFAAAVDDIVASMGEQAEIKVVGRNNIDLTFMLQRDNEGRFSIHNEKGDLFIRDKRHPQAKITYITVHRSKGLEADNVIVINLRNHLIGFPNKISDDPLLALVLTEADLFLYAEERRLFYVAITRTKNRTYLIAPEKDTSVFVEELIKEQSIPFEIVTNEQTIRTNPKCDVCLTGVLMIRQSNDGRSFLGCSNYPGCNKTYKELNILQNPIRCTKCGGYMLKRKGPTGEFYGCSNYPTCHNSMNIKFNVKS